MMSEIARLHATISVDLTQLKNGLRQTRTELQSTAGGMGQVSREFGLGAAGALGLSLGVAAIGAQAVRTGQEMVRLGMDMEQARLAFTTLLGSAEAAEAFLAELREFASKTPFEFTQLLTAARRMMAFGFAAEEVIPKLTAIGDAMAAMGARSDSVDRVVLALGQMQAKTKVSAQEMLQLTEAGVPAWRYLSEAMGLTTAEVMKLSERGLIPAAEAIDAIIAGMQKDFGGMMAEQAKTGAGSLSNFNDELERFKTNLGEVALPPLTGYLQFGAGRLEAYNMAVEAFERGAIGAAEFGGVLLWLSTVGFEASGEVDYLGGRMEAFDARTQRAHETVRRLIEAYGNISAGQLFDMFAGADTRQQLSDIMDAAEWAELKAFVGGLWDNTTEQRLQALLEQFYEVGRVVPPANWHFAQTAEALAEVKGQIENVTRAVRDVPARRDVEVSVEVSGADQISAILAGVRGEQPAPIRIDILNASVNSNWSQEIRDFENGQAALREEIAATQEALLAAQSGFTGQFGVTADQLAVKLGELETKYADNATAHDLATRRILFNMLQQELANQGLLEQSGGALAELALKWGIMDEATYEAWQATLFAVEMIKSGLAGLDTPIQDLDRFYQLWRDLGSMEAVRKYLLTLEVNYLLHGIQHDPAAGEPGPGTDVNWGDDEGGVWGGKQAFGGSYLVNTPTWFKAGESGMEIASFTPLRGGMSEGAGLGGGSTWTGDLVIQGASDPRATAREVIRALQDRGIVSRVGVR